MRMKHDKHIWTQKKFSILFESTFYIYFLMLIYIKHTMDFFKNLAKGATSGLLGTFGGLPGSVLAGGLNSLYRRGGTVKYKKGNKQSLRPKPVKRAKRKPGRHQVTHVVRRRSGGIGEGHLQHPDHQQ